MQTRYPGQARTLLQPPECPSRTPESCYETKSPLLTATPHNQPHPAPTPPTWSPHLPPPSATRTNFSTGLAATRKPRGPSNPRQPTPSKPLKNRLLLLLLLLPLLPLLPTHLPQPGIDPLPRAFSPRPNGSRRIGLLLHNRPRLTPAIPPIDLHRPSRPGQCPYSPRHRPFVQSIRMSRRRHENRLKRQPRPTPTRRYASGPPKPFKPLDLPGQQPSSQDRRRQQGPEQHHGPPPHLPASPPGHSQKLAMGDERESDHLSWLYRSSEHP